MDRIDYEIKYTFINFQSCVFQHLIILCDNKWNKLLLREPRLTKTDTTTEFSQSHVFVSIYFFTW
jgi:hypothetical protein